MTLRPGQTAAVADMDRGFTLLEARQTPAVADMDRGFTLLEARQTPAVADMDRGFTLLEVLAAALIFALAVTVLIGTSSAGVRMSEVSARRLEAGLLADAELAEIEMRLSSQLSPPPAKEKTDDVYAVRVLVEPALAPSSSNGDDSSAGAGSLGALLALEAPGIEAFLLRYEVRVEWLDNVQPMVVRRTTFAFDWEGAKEALPDLFGVGLEGDDDAKDSEGEPPEVDSPQALE